MATRAIRSSREFPFRCYRNEIFGIAGVSGNGQRELVEAITGLRQVRTWPIRINGIDITNQSPRKIHNNGVSHVPEERIRFGIAPNLFLYENAILKQHHQKKFSRRAFLAYGRIKAHTKQLIKDFQVATPSINVQTKNLSGGNIQKLILGREIRQTGPAGGFPSRPTAWMWAPPSICATSCSNDGQKAAPFCWCPKIWTKFSNCAIALPLFFKDGSWAFWKRKTPYRGYRIDDGRNQERLEDQEMEQMLHVKVADREQISAIGILFDPGLALAAGLLVIGFIFLLCGVNPIFAFKKIFSGSFGSLYGFQGDHYQGHSAHSHRRRAGPGVQGQILEYRRREPAAHGRHFRNLGGLELGPSLPSWVIVPLMFFAGFLGGALWGLIPAILKLRFSINEVIST
jgi:predicted ABC-type transport system involved in lysophospholipase L1 biosynthesis ATPase subunit